MAADLGRPGFSATLHVSADGSVVASSSSMSPRQRFPIASVTKTLTAVTAAALRAQGVVDWDAPTGFFDQGGTPFSLRNLLRHVARVPNELHPRHWIVGESLSCADLDTLRGRVPTVDLPPLTWHYSNLGYALAAKALEDATGESFARLLSRLVLQPLGMSDTSFPDSAQPERLGAAESAAAAAGGLWSTLEDLVILGHALEGSRPDVITVAMLSWLLEGATPDSSGGWSGAGLRLQPEVGATLIVTTGTLHGTTTCLAVWPRRGVSVLVADAGSSHAQLWNRAKLQWRRPDRKVRTWWLDAQPVDEIRAGDDVELVLRASGWPFPFFAGRAQPAKAAASGALEVLTGIDWQHRSVTLTRTAAALTGSNAVLTAAVGDSAFEERPGD